MKLFGGNTTAALEKTGAAIAATEGKIAALQVQRAELLASEDGIEQVQQLDRSIEAQHRALVTYQDKLAALQQRFRQEQQEQERAVQLKVIAKALAVRRQWGAEADAAAAQLGEAFFNLMAADNIAPLWPFEAPWPNFGMVDRDAVHRELGWALFSAGRPKGGITTLPSPTNAGLASPAFAPSVSKPLSSPNVKASLRRCAPCRSARRLMTLCRLNSRRPLRPPALPRLRRRGDEHERTRNCWCRHDRSGNDHTGECPSR
jgi:hypothetical protein